MDSIYDQIEKIKALDSNSSNQEGALKTTNAKLKELAYLLGRNAAIMDLTKESKK